MMHTALLYARTIRHLEPEQIYARLRRRPATRPVRFSPRLRVAAGLWTEPICRRPAQVGPNRFCFLNQEREIRSWNDSNTSQLWLYNLHYFEHADAVLIERWIAENPVAQGIGWDPFPSSLRITNWSKWILNGSRPSQSILMSLATQAQHLEKRLERHLLANHLLANAKALLFAGCLIDGPDADRWRTTGTAILDRELPRQILADGAHVERSPMYHSLVLEDLLDLCNLRRTFSNLAPSCERYASRMLGWLNQMTHPDGQISFFNDAAFGVAPEPSQLTEYARRLGIEAAHLALGESGYVRLENDNTVVIFDAAPLGPDYQPGHSHADALSFELSFKRRRVFVNSGTSTYDLGPERCFERGTPAHNTVCVDGLNQSEMWASFRVARRARPFDLRTDQRSFAEAAHDGYKRLRAPIIHRRRIELQNDALLISDWLEGTGPHTAEIYFHLAPSALMPRIELDPRLIRAVEKTTYRPGFNSTVPNITVAGRWSGECPAVFRTRILLASMRNSDDLEDHLTTTTYA